MKVVPLGATGFVGSALLKEALDRGHRVTAIVRNPVKLEKRDGVVDDPAMPDWVRQSMLWNQLRKEPELEWTFLAPSAEMKPGERTGKFRLGGDQLLVDSVGHSNISVQDFAVAMIDELERPLHLRQRFTVGY